MQINSPWLDNIFITLKIKYCGRDAAWNYLTRFPLRYGAGIPPELFHSLLAEKRNPEVDVNSGRIVQYIGSLNSGGSERQLCNLVIGLKRKDLDVTVYTYNELTGEHAHYLELLNRSSLNAVQSGSAVTASAKDALLRNRPLLQVLRRLPHIYYTGALELLGAIINDPPVILHSWLDQTNICAGIAGLLAGVPVIILSSRSVNPDYYPRLANSLYRPWYKMLTQFEQIRFINNSIAGARDYCRWLDLPENRIRVIHNGVDPGSLSRAGEDRIRDYRNSLNINTDSLVIAGIFRMTEEKRPLIFIQVCLEAMRQVPNLEVIIAGTGPYEQDVRKMVDESGYSAQFHFVGRIMDITLLLSTADLLLLTSRMEGTPNVVLEAEWLGCPVVATRVGGTVDAILHGKTGYLVNVDDVEDITGAVLDLLRDRERREAFARAGPVFIRERFSMDNMVAETIGVYNDALAELHD